jgi:hypothetical protein
MKSGPWKHRYISPVGTGDTLEPAKPHEKSTLVIWPARLDLSVGIKKLIPADPRYRRGGTRHNTAVPTKPKPLERLPPAESIEEVLDSIAKIITWSIANPSRVGYFAALYKRITLAVQKAIADNEFQDGTRMEKFDVAFANRYFDALNGHFHPRKFGRPTKTWQLSLREAGNGKPIIVQHLLGGCNAHIALDLGITAHEIAAGNLPGLRDDFNKINDILAGQTSDVVNSIDKVSRVLADVHALLKSYEIDLIDDLLKYLRDRAWQFAELLSRETDRAQIAEKIATRDLEMAQLGKMIYDPPLFMLAIVEAVATEEQRDVVKNIQDLEEIASAPYKPATGRWLCGFVQSTCRELRGLASATVDPALAVIGIGRTRGRSSRR